VAHLVDYVLPDVAVRQCVLSLPVDSQRLCRFDSHRAAQRRGMRTPSFKSIGQPVIQRKDRVSRCRSLTCSTPPKARRAA